MPLDNGSGRLCGSIGFKSLASKVIHLGGVSNFKLTICIHEEGDLISRMTKMKYFCGVIHQGGGKICCGGMSFE